MKDAVKVTYKTGNQNRVTVGSYTFPRGKEVEVRTGHTEVLDQIKAAGKAFEVAGNEAEVVVEAESPPVLTKKVGKKSSKKKSLFGKS